MKKFFSLMVFISIMLPCLSWGQSYALGDVNHDQNIDVADSLLIAQYYVGFTPSLDLNLADVDASNVVDIVDALLIVQYYVGIIDSLPGEVSKSHFDWNGIIGTGQSLSTGTGPITSTTQPYNNLKLSLGFATVPPWQPNNQSLSMVPLIEPIRPEISGYPRPYPGNIWGETYHSTMGNQITYIDNNKHRK